MFFTQKAVSSEGVFNLDKIDQLVLHIDVNGTIIAEDKAGGEANITQFIEKLLDRATKEGQEISDAMLAAIESKLAASDKEAAVNIFPGFFRLLDQLDKQHVNYKVIIRTFGEDIPVITSEIIRHRPDIAFENIDFKSPNFDAAKQREFFRSVTLGQWTTVQENFTHWSQNGKTAQAGKQLCLNNDPRILDVFFDDCVNRKDIIHVVTADGSTMNREEAIARGHLVHVDTLDAFCDDMYFVAKLKTSCASYARYADSLQLEALPLLGFKCTV